MNSEKSSHLCRGSRFWITILGVAFFLLAAACEFEAAFCAFRQVANFGSFLRQPSVTAEAISLSMASMSHSRGTADWCTYAGFALMMLGFACIHLGGTLGCSCRKSEPQSPQ